MCSKSSRAKYKQPLPATAAASNAMPRFQKVDGWGKRGSVECLQVVVVHQHVQVFEVRLGICPWTSTNNMSNAQHQPPFLHKAICIRVQ